jgi:hypothetical protein
MQIILGNLLFGHLFDSGRFFFLAGLIAASMFFILVGIRYLKLRRVEGLMFLAMAVFFIVANVAFLLTESAGTIISGIRLNFSIWNWMAVLMGPAVVILYLSFGIYSLFKFELNEAILKTILAVALIMILYTVGFNWPTVVKAGCVVLFGIGWFVLELKAVREIN